MKIADSTLRRLLLLVIAAMMTATATGAQDTLPRLDPGTRVRLRSMDWERDEIKGNIVSWGVDSAAVSTGNAVQRVALLDLDRIQLSGGRSAWRGAAKWGLTATAVMAAVVIPMGVVESAQGPAEGQIVSPTIALAAVGVVFVIPVATLTGALVGGERWYTHWVRP